MIGPGESKWSYQELDIPLTAINMLLVRITVAKILERVREILQSVPLRPDEKGWNCVGWVKEALEMLGEDDKALGTRAILWETVRDTAPSYCDGKKEAHRFDGKAQPPVDTTWAPTFSLTSGKEVIP